MTTAFRRAYASVPRFVVALPGRATGDARVVITTAPGEEGQVDYGDPRLLISRKTVLIPKTGRCCRASCRRPTPRHRRRTMNWLYGVPRKLLHCTSGDFGTEKPEKHTRPRVRRYT